MSEILFIILLAGGMLIPSAIFKQWWLFSVFIVFFVIFGLIEWLAVKKTGKTVSQHFWALEGKKGKIIIIVGMVVAWAALLIHLWG